MTATVHTGRHSVTLTASRLMYRGGVVAEARSGGRWACGAPCQSGPTNAMALALVGWAWAHESTMMAFADAKALVTEAITTGDRT